MEANPVEVAVSAEAQALSMVTDRRLLARVLTNLVKNAVEASSPGERVSLNCAEDDGKVVFTVHNPGVMKPEVRAQVFQHAFSTKGPGRGLGTYSVKLLTERYLEGEVGFVSTEAAGTTFHVALPVTHPLESD
jgi:signal transduction histidine kinase